MRWKSTLLVLGALVASTVGSAGASPRAAPTDPVADVVDPALRDAAAAAIAADGPGATITVEIVKQPGPPRRANPSVVAAGGRARSSSRADGLGVPVLAEVPAASIAGLQRSAGVRYVRLPQLVDARPDRAPGVPLFGPTTGAQVALLNADAWHTAGFTGAGVKIGVIDFFDEASYWNTAEMGPVPSTTGHAICRWLGSDCLADLQGGSVFDGDDHGEAVVEVIKDMAPDAEIFIAMVASASDYVDAIDFFAANGVTVINRSLGSFYDGPGDGRATLDTIADYAVGKGIVWFNSAGNAGAGSYVRVTSVALSSNYVDFDTSAGTDTWLKLKGPNRCTYLGGVRWATDWDVSDKSDYRLELYRGNNSTNSTNPTTTTLIATADANQTAGAAPIEVFGSPDCAGASEALYLRVRYMGGGSSSNDIIEVLDYGGAMLEHTSKPYSASISVVDSKNEAVLAVGAVDPPAGGVIANYSSQGPTNDGRTKPDISATSGMYSATFAGTFSGTSSSSPTAAGVAALARSAYRCATPTEIAALLRSWTIDRGAAGTDNVYGAGELHLPDPPQARVLLCFPAHRNGLERAERIAPPTP